jgi:putative hydrolase of the HAD superfamily
MATRGVEEIVSQFSTIRAVTFDVGGTLIRPWPSVGHIYAEMAGRHGFDGISPELLNHNFAAAWQARKNFNHTRSDWSDLVNRTFTGLLSHPPGDSFFEELYDRFAEPDCWKVFADVLPALEDLRNLDIRVGIISNWDERLTTLLPRLNLSDYFETIVVSYEVGFPKPSNVIFEYASRKLGLPPGNILHVGDSSSEDYEGARSASFSALLIDRETEEKPNTISSLRQISNHLASR